jgi:hypothetical protein
MEELLAIDYGAIGRLLLRRPATDAPFDRALLLLGKAVERTADSERSGFWIRADLPTLDLDEWLSFRTEPAESRHEQQRANDAGLRRCRLDATSLYAFGRKFKDATVSARRAGDEWRVALGAAMSPAPRCGRNADTCDAQRTHRRAFVAARDAERRRCAAGANRREKPLDGRRSQRMAGDRSRRATLFIRRSATSASSSSLRVRRATIGRSNR